MKPEYVILNADAIDFIDFEHLPELAAPPMEAGKTKTFDQKMKILWESIQRSLGYEEALKQSSTTSCLSKTLKADFMQTSLPPDWSQRVEH
jgi:hypothetical protein